jgi:multicomponent Na+:H+ antiporter subunit F
MIALFAAAGALIALALTLVRLFGGPTLYDRVLAANAISAKVVLVIAAIAAAVGQAELVDVAFALALASFVVNAAVLKFFRARTFQAPLARVGEEVS